MLTRRFFISALAATAATPVLTGEASAETLFDRLFARDRRGLSARARRRRRRALRRARARRLRRRRATRRRTTSRRS